MKMKNNFLLFLFLNVFSIHLSFSNDAILNDFESQAKSIDVKFISFSVSDGEKVFRTKRVNSSGEKVSCMTCHTENPKASGLTRANKIIEPIAPVANKERFTDMAKVEKWFKRNCNDVFERPCTLKEKGDFTKYMMSIK